LPGAARAEDAQQICDAPLSVVRLAHPLAHVARKLITGEAITIVAIGSSSTAGAGASSPAMNYPSRLQVELTGLFKRNHVTVINRGVNGEEIADMLTRFDQQVIAEKPDLILWQLGTNSIIRDHKDDNHGAGIREGLAKARAVGADVILIDPQFAPKVVVKAEAPRMVELIAATAKQEDVALFPRYELMRRWHDVDHMPFESFVSPDGLHMNDWSYGCVAKAMAAAIAEAAMRPVATATSAAAMNHVIP
jgi:lysophospholipase L1-like esterase